MDIAHHRIPLLSVMHNNRAYHQEVMHLQRMADRHQRGITTRRSARPSRIRISIMQPWPAVWECMAKGLSPIPTTLGPALKRALEVVLRGEPALIDVVTQPR